ncbi:hypothetical protein A1j_00039 [Klebsiella phage VLCpiA1j]|nr:hypothetical protein A1j_00039 [Klebsiella phage VLCpiA1j]
MHPGAFSIPNRITSPAPQIVVSIYLCISYCTSKLMLSAICPVGGTAAPARMTLSLNLVTHCTTVEPVVRSRHYSFTGQCLSAPVVFGLLAPPSSPTAPLRSCSLTDYLGSVVIVPAEVLGLPANQLTACYLSYSVNPNLSIVYFLLFASHLAILLRAFVRCASASAG